jgi:hypothetical protein
MIDAVVALAPKPGLTAGACVALNLSRAIVYRQRWHLARSVPAPGARLGLLSPLVLRRKFPKFPNGQRLESESCST